ncbi:MAG TPA: TonB-dependent receptor [Solirubrobacteraceae bacterium]|nr:TonB-dependent receptor [Solirubrobacteraceae bacterium]
MDQKTRCVASGARRRAIGAAAGCGLALAGPAVAQEQAAASTANAEESLQTITVTGVRAAVESAINVKQRSDNIVEVISAEDIGKLPDTSIAESISRLPGLTSQRSDGRASDISIRGTDPQFATGLLNGREQVSTGDNRAIEYDQYPAELISGVVVYKTPDAALIGQGLSGTIALETIRPLEYGHRATVLDFRMEKNSDADMGADSKNNGYRGSFSFIDQFLDNTLGIAVGYARLSSPVVGRELGLYDPWHANGTEHAGVGADVDVTDGIKSLASMGSDVRDGALGTVEWRPTSSYTSTLDVYWTSELQNNNRRSLEVNLGNYNGYPNATCPACTGTANFSNLDVVNNALVGATVSNVVPLARNFLYLTSDQIFQAGWNNKWKGAAWNLMTDLAYSRATRDEHDYETQGQYIGGVTDTITYFLPNGSQPTFTAQNNYSDPSQVLVGPTIYGGGYSRFPHVVDELKSFRLEGTRQAGGWFSDVTLGANYDDRSKDKTQPETGLNTVGGTFDQIGSQYLLSPANLSFSGTPSSLAWNVPGVLAAYFDPVVPGYPNEPGYGYLTGKFWDVFEKLTTLYIRGDLNHPLSADVTLRGNIGLQVIHTQQSSTSFSYNEATQSSDPIEGGKSYNDILPAMNLVFELPAQQLLRFSAAREMARPRMDQMTAGQDFSVATTTGVPSNTAGNPLLDPWRADALDLSYEKYFENKAYLSAAVFYKDLKTYIYDQTFLTDLSGLVAQLPPPGAGQHPYLDQGYLTVPLNGQGGRLDGIELTASAPGELLAPWLSGFGANASVSLTDSSITVPGQVAGENAANITLPGLSKTVASAMLYYEKSGFAARIASRYRSDYIGEITDFAGDRALEYVRHELITDFQTSYEFQKGPAKGLMILFQVNNMTNTPFIDYSGNVTQTRDYETFGRDFFFGLNYKF